MQYHPDRNPNNPDAEERFKEVTEAYAILADSEKRSLYDRFGHAGVGNAASPSGGFDATTFQDFGEIFGEFFGFGDAFGGGGRRRSRVQRGADLREDLTIEFEEAAFGTDTRVMVRLARGLRRLPRLRSGAGQRSNNLPCVQWPRAGTLSAGFFQHRAHLSFLSGKRQRNHRSVPEV